MRRRSIGLVGRIRRTDWLPVRGDPASEEANVSSLSFSSGSDEPGSSDMEDADAAPLHQRQTDCSKDDDSENELLERSAQGPPQHDVDEEAMPSWRALVEDLRGLSD